MSRNTAARRAGWVTLLLSLVIALAGLAPASAATARTITVAPSATAAPLGSVVTLKGTLSRSPIRSSLTVQRKVGTSWVKVTSTRTTTKAGAYKAGVVLPRKIGTYSFRVIAPKTGSLSAATSKVVKIAALTKVTATLTATPKKVAADAFTTLTGTVKPFVSGSTVSIQRQTGLNTWVTVTTATLTSAGKFGKAVKPVNATTYRVAVPRRGTKAPAFSVGIRVDTTPVIATTSLPGGSVGTAYTTTLKNVGNQSGTWSAAPLPAGLSLNATTGVISGTPTGAGTQQVVIGFTQQYTGYPAPQKTLSLTVTTPPPPTPPTITTGSLSDAQVGVAYSKQLAADQTPGTWSTTTTLPSGLTLSPGGLLSGTPAAIGPNPVTTNIDLRFTNTNTTLFGTKTLALTVNPPPPPPAPVILNQGPALPDGAALTAYSYQLYVSGNVAGTWGATGLPSGISIDSATGEISGTTLLPSNSTVTVTFTQTSPAVAAIPKVYSLHIGALGSAKPPTQVSAGGAFSCRVDDARKLWCWGYDDSGQLGDGGGLVADPPGVSTPTQVGSATTWTGITTGGSGLLTERHACGLTGTTGYCWGSDKYGELGSSAATGTSTSPVVINGGRSWSSLAAGWTSTCGITTAGALFCWGDNTYGQVGVVTGLPQSTSPVAVGTDSDWVQVSVGYNHACALKGTGTLWCWGANFRGQLGNGTNDAAPTPTQVGSASDWKSVTAGSGYTCATKGTGSLWCWGPSSNGQLGNGTTVNDSSTDALSPLQVGSATDWKSVSADDGTTCAVKGAGELWCWGKNTVGQVGDNSTTVRPAPTRVGTDSDWNTVSVGASHACGVKAGDEIWCWGSNPKGELGSAPLAASVPAPRQVVG